MNEYLKRLLNTIFFMIVFLGIPYLTGNWLWLWISWLPAIILIEYLNEER